MCGIIGICGREDAVPVLIDGLKRLEYRGYDSSGIAAVDKCGIQICKTAGKVDNLASKIKEGMHLHGKVGIGHTRWATHGKPDDINAHPHCSGDGKFAVVHNGIIENYAELRILLEKEGYIFKSSTDTEVVAHLLQKFYCDNIKDAVIKTTHLLKGSFALAIVCTETPDTIYAARKSSPIILGLGDTFNCVASDITAFASVTDKAVYLEDGEFAEITSEEIKIYDFNGNPVKREATHIEYDATFNEKSGYEHFMLKEIMEQPDVFGRTLNSKIINGNIEIDDTILQEKSLKNFSKILITACGSAYYAGCAAKYCIEKLCRIPVCTELASELRYSNPIIGEDTLLIVISQSGETADTIAAMNECKRLGAKVLAVVNVADSTVSKGADCVIYTSAGPEIAVATTKGYTTQLAVLYMVALHMAYNLKRIDREELDFLTGKLMLVPEKMRKALNNCKKISEVAKRYYDVESMFFIGRNTDYATAMEAALKMKEISYIHAESYAAGELKHGTIALVGEKTPVVAIYCNKNISEKTINNIMEVKSRGATVIGVTTDNNGKNIEFTDDLILLPESDEMFGTAVEIIPLQLLSYYIAKKKGCDIDKPRNLAKSVTVE